MYPNDLIKGIPNSYFLDDDGSPSSSLFYFGLKNLLPRDDGFNEESINWYDNHEALTIVLSQKKDDGSFQFKTGAAILIRMEIDRIRRYPYVKNRLSYERRARPENKYHGNLLLKRDVPKALMKKIAASIALSVSEVKQRVIDKKIESNLPAQRKPFFSRIWECINRAINWFN